MFLFYLNEIYKSNFHVTLRKSSTSIELEKATEIAKYCLVTNLFLIFLFWQYTYTYIFVHYFLQKSLQLDSKCAPGANTFTRVFLRQLFDKPSLMSCGHRM